MQGMSHPLAYMVLNAGAAVATAAAAALMPGALTHLYPTMLTWAPVAAFFAASLSCWKRVASWLPFIGLGLNLACVLLFFLVGYASATDANIGPAGFAFAVPGGCMAAWNTFHLSTWHSHD